MLVGTACAVSAGGSRAAPALAALGTALGLQIGTNLSNDVLDFDRGAVRNGSGWKRRNLNRLRRSLDKIARTMDGAFEEPDWDRLLRGYGSAAYRSG